MSRLQEFLNKSNFDGFGTDWRAVNRYQHVERFGHDEVDGILNGTVYVQDKIDGANLTVCSDPKAGMIIASRNMVKSIKCYPAAGFNGAVEYVIEHDGLRELSERFILRGEWLVKHTINYPEDAWGKFYLFDVQEYGTFRYLSPEEYEPWCSKLGIQYVPVIAKIDKPTMEDIQPYTSGNDFLGVEKEGIVLKNYNFVNHYNRTKWAKVVQAKFKEQNHLTFGRAPKRDAELHFATSCVPKELVYKTIEKIKETNGGISKKNISEILGRVWYDVFTEELWSFVKKNKTDNFNFRRARVLVSKRTAMLAIEYIEDRYEA